MNIRIMFGTAMAAVATFAVLTAPAHAAFLYSSGPVNGSIEGWTISDPFSVTDSFTLASGGDLETALYYSWEFAGDHETGIDWAITSSAFGPILDSGFATPTTAVVFPDQQFDGGQIGAGYYDIDSNAIALPNIDLAAGTYWLELSGATDTGGVSYWDENGGAGSAEQNYYYTLTGAKPAFNNIYSIPVNSFNLYGGAYVPTPEASSYIGLMLGVAGLAAFGIMSVRKRSSLSA